MASAQFKHSHTKIIGGAMRYAEYAMQAGLANDFSQLLDYLETKKLLNKEQLALIKEPREQLNANLAKINAETQSVELQSFVLSISHDDSDSSNAETQSVELQNFVLSISHDDSDSSNDETQSCGSVSEDDAETHDSEKRNSLSSEDSAAELELDSGREEEEKAALKNESMNSPADKTNAGLCNWVVKDMASCSNIPQLFKNHKKYRDQINQAVPDIAKYFQPIMMIRCQATELFTTEYEVIIRCRKIKEAEQIFPAFGEWVNSNRELNEILQHYYAMNFVFVPSWERLPNIIHYGTADNKIEANEVLKKLAYNTNKLPGLPALTYALSHMIYNLACADDNVGRLINLSKYLDKLNVEFAKKFPANDNETNILLQEAVARLLNCPNQRLYKYKESLAALCKELEKLSKFDIGIDNDILASRFSRVLKFIEEQIQGLNQHQRECDMMKLIVDFTNNYSLKSIKMLKLTPEYEQQTIAFYLYLNSCMETMKQHYSRIRSKSSLMLFSVADSFVLHGKKMLKNFSKCVLQDELAEVYKKKFLQKLAKSIEETAEKLAEIEVKKYRYMEQYHHMRVEWRNSADRPKRIGEAEQSFASIVSSLVAQQSKKTLSSVLTSVREPTQSLDDGDITDFDDLTYSSTESDLSVGSDCAVDTGRSSVSEINESLVEQLQAMPTRPGIKGSLFFMQEPKFPSLSQHEELYPASVFDAPSTREQACMQKKTI